MVAALSAASIWSCGPGVDAQSDQVAPDEQNTAQAELHSSRSKTYRVTVRNVTGGNAISPPLVLISSDNFQFFTAGEPSSAGVAKVAETGGTDVLEAELAAAADVRAVAKASGGPLMAGQTRVIEITVPAGRWRPLRLNVIAMIGRSNDSFVSSSRGFSLSAAEDQVISSSLTNFDSGTEENTGNVEDFGPGGHPTEHAEGLVSYDRGLNSRGNAPEYFGWGSTAATITIERI